MQLRPLPKRLLVISIGTSWAVHFIKPQDFFPAIIHDDVYETLTDADKDVLGFRVVREDCGAIGPRTPSDTRSNLNVRYPYIPELLKGGSKTPVPLKCLSDAPWRAVDGGARRGSSGHESR